MKPITVDQEAERETAIKLIVPGLAFLTIAVCAVTPAHAWLRLTVDDADLMARSELIVVAALQKDSIHKIDHKNGDSHWWENSATLTIKEVLKGKCSKNELPIIIHYGLDPTPREAKLLLDDTGNSDYANPPDADLTQDNIWCLRHLSGEYGREPGGDAFGIVDPEDFQPLADKDYLLTYLQVDPEPLIRQQMQKEPDIAARAVRYLTHCDIQRIAKIADPAERAERLLPYWLNRNDFSSHDDANEELIKTGKAAGPFLMAACQTTGDLRLETRIISTWAKIHYEGCQDTLLASLKMQNNFWKHIQVDPGWFTHSPPTPLDEELRDRSDLLLATITTLSEIGDPQAIPDLTATVDLWVTLPQNPYAIAPTARAALKQIASRNVH